MIDILTSIYSCLLPSYHRGLSLVLNMKIAITKTTRIETTRHDEARRGNFTFILLFLLVIGITGIIDFANAAESRSNSIIADKPRCVVTRSDVIRHSDIIAMYQTAELDDIKKYRIDTIAWGAQLNPTPELIEKRQKLIKVLHDAGIRFNSINLTMVQEGGKFLVCDGDKRTANRISLYYRLRKNNKATLRQISESGIDLKKYGVLDINGNLVGVPWLSKRWFIPMACSQNSLVRKWFHEQIDALMSTGATALHFDEPCMSAYALSAKNPGCFCDQCVAAFTDYLKFRPERIWKEAGIHTLNDFNYRKFVKAKDCHPTKAPLWREFVRFQLLSNADFVCELRDRARSKAKGYLPFSTNANATTWIKFPTLSLQDFMTTEVAHSAKSRKIPDGPLLTYKLGATFGQPVVTTAHGYDWYEMKTNQHPILVSAWVAQAYALGHHMMIP